MYQFPKCELVSTSSKVPRATSDPSSSPSKKRLQGSQDVEYSEIHIRREINRSDTSSIYEIELHSATYAMKLVSITDPCFCEQQ